MREHKEFETILKQRTIGRLLLAGGLALALIVPQLTATPAQAEAVYDIKEMPRPDIPGLVISPDDPLQNLTARSAVVIDAGVGGGDLRAQQGRAPLPGEYDEDHDAHPGARALRHG